MKLPPSIEAIINVRTTIAYERELVQAIAHEACRLQREADLVITAEGEALVYHALRNTPLVVPSTES